MQMFVQKWTEQIRIIQSFVSLHCTIPTTCDYNNNDID